MSEVSLSAASIQAEARRLAFPRAFYRLEVAVIALVAAVLTSLTVLDIIMPPRWWWLWPLFGMCGGAAIVYSSLRDSTFMLPIIASVVYTRLDHRSLRLLDVRDDMSEALHYHKLVFHEIAHQQQPALGVIVSELDKLLFSMYRMARALDAFVSDDFVRDYLQTIAPGTSTESTANASSSQAVVSVSLTRYTALLNARSSELALPDSDQSRHDLLRRIYEGLTQARCDLQDAIKRMVIAHGKVAGITRDDDDWTFIPQVRSDIARQTEQLETRTESIDALRRNCETAAAVYAG